MAKEIDVSALSSGAVKSKALIFNIIIAALCVAAIVVMCTGSFMTLSVEYKLTDDMLQQTSGGGESGGQDVTQYTAMLTDDDRTVKLNINVSSAVMLSSVIASSEDIASNLIGDQINNFIKQAKPLILKVTKIFAKAAVSVLLDECKTALSETVADVDAHLAELGLDAETLTGDIDGILDNLLSDKPDVEKVKGDILGIMERVTEASGQPLDPDIEQGFTGVYDKIIVQSLGEDGSLDPAALLQNIFDMMNNSSNGEEQASSGVIKLSEGDVPSAEEELRAQIVAMLGEETLPTLALVIRIIGIVEALMLVAWAYVVLKIVIKLFASKNKTVRFSVAAIPAFILMLLLAVLPWVLTSFILPSMGGLPPGLGGISAMSTVFLITGVISLALFIVWLAGYRKTRKQSKAMIAAGLM